MSYTQTTLEFRHAIRINKMGLFGKILSVPIKLVNAPIKAMEDTLLGVDHDDDRIMSKPLDKLAEHIKEIDEWE